MLSANDANDRAEQMLILAERIAGFADREIAAIKANKLDAAAVENPEKERLVHAWRHEVERIRKSPALISEADPELKAKLREAAKTLETTLRRHAASVEGLKTLTEGLVRAVAEEVARTRKGPEGYGRVGARGHSASAGGGVTVNAKV